VNLAIGTLVHLDPKLKEVQRAEVRKMTVIEYNSTHPQADEYRQLARKIENNTHMTIPTPLTMDELEELMMEFGILDM